MNTKELIVEKVKKKFSESVEEISDFRDDLCIAIKKDQIVNLGKFLKEDPDLQCVAAVDVGFQAAGQD